VGVRAILGDFDDLPTKPEIPIRILGILDADRNVGISPHVLILDAAFGAVQDHMRSIEIAPDGCDLRSSVFHHRSKMCEGALIKKVPKVRWNFVGHEKPP